MRVAILFNDDGALEHGQAKDSLAVAAVAICARAVADALRSRGHEPTLVSAPDDPAALIDSVRGARSDVVFNLVESLHGDAALESCVAALLELCGIPFTGSGALACALGLRKTLAKSLLAAAGVPVAPGMAMETGDEPLPPQRWPFPWIVKPTRED